MYRKVTQLRFEDFVFPYGELDPGNEWVSTSGKNCVGISNHQAEAEVQ